LTRVISIGLFDDTNIQLGIYCLSSAGLRTLIKRVQHLNTVLRATMLFCGLGFCRWGYEERPQTECGREELDIGRDTVQDLQIRRLTYFGHVVQMNTDRYPHVTHVADVLGEERR